MIKTDILIIGAGIGALSIASELCKYNKKITIVTKGNVKSCNSSLAQGGISVALSDKDDYHWHYEDTMTAGCNLNDSDAVMKLVSKAPSVIKEFIDTGMEFDKDENGDLAFGREGAHRLNRIIHAGGDRTGLRVVEQLLRNVASPNVDIRQNEMALDLRVENGSCSGVITRSFKTGEITYYQANYTILATGGIGQLYPATSNDTTITGDGIAMAYRAGCELKNLEFIQFHPTMLTINGKAYGLVSEAVRGAGGILVNEKGEKIMEGVHPQKDLAPRDVVSREVYAHYLKGEKIFLDISAVDDFEAKFPTVTEICLEHGINLNDKLIPVAPGAHFHMGGVKASPEGITNIKGLFAVGETACTGVHGANRLASNSLLEGLVFGKLTADHILNNERTSPEITDNDGKITVSSLPSKKEIQDQMMNFVGIVRHSNEMQKIINWFESYSPDKFSSKLNIESNSNDTYELYNMLTAGWLIAKAASKRKESIGAHYTV